MDSREIAEKAAENLAMEVAYHIESMYPQAVKASPKSFLVSVRGFIINKLKARAIEESRQPTKPRSKPHVVNRYGAHMDNDCWCEERRQEPPKK